MRHRLYILDLTLFGELQGSEYTICAGVGHSIVSNLTVLYPAVSRTNVRDLEQMLQVPAEFNAWLNQVIRTARGKPIKLEQEAKPVF